MSGPDTAGMREALAEALREHCYWSSQWMPERDGAEGLADALLPVVQRLIADAEKRAAAREADSIADTVLALADDFLAAFPPDDAGIDVAIDLDEAYDWLIAQAAAIRERRAEPQAAVDPAGSPHNSFPHRRVHAAPAAHQKLAGQAHTGTPKAPGTGVISSDRRRGV